MRAQREVMNMAAVNRFVAALQASSAYFSRVDAQPSSGPPSAAVEREAGSIDGSSIDGSDLDACNSTHIPILSV